MRDFIKTKGNYLLAAALIAIGILLYLNGSFLEMTDYEACKSNLSLPASGHSINMLVDIHFYAGKGTAELRGLYVDKDKKRTEIYRDVFFDYLKRKEKYILKSTEISTRGNNVVPDRIIAEAMSDFFTQKGATLSLTRKKSGSGQKIFLWSGLPIFYCFKS